MMESFRRVLGFWRAREASAPKVQAQIHAPSTSTTDAPPAAAVVASASATSNWHDVAAEFEVPPTGGTIPNPHERGITLKELELVNEYVRRHCEAESWMGTRFDEHGRPTKVALTPETVNLYDIDVNMLKPLTATPHSAQTPAGLSFVERLAKGPRQCKVFLSHAWAHPYEKTLAVIRQHFEDREFPPETVIWICVFALRQNNPGSEIDGIPIERCPFYRAIKDAKVTLIVVGEMAEWVSRVWCGLEAYLALMEGAEDSMLTDIYTHFHGTVERLTDGLIASDRGSEDVVWAVNKGAREARFPVSVIKQMMRFDLNKASTSMQSDKDSILAYVHGDHFERERGSADGLAAASPVQGGRVATLNATVSASAFVAAFAQLARSAESELPVGFEALRGSAQGKLSLTEQLEPRHIHMLLQSLPAALVELNLCGCGLIDGHAATIGVYITASKTLRSVNLASNQLTDIAALVLSAAIKGSCSLASLNLWRNQVGDKGVVGLGESLKTNCSLTRLDLDTNLFGDAGAVSLGEAVAVNSSLTRLDIDRCSIADVGAISLGKGLALNASLTKLGLGEHRIGDEGATSLGEALAVNTTLTELHLYTNRIGDKGAASLGLGLKTNGVLTRLWLGNNAIGDEGAVSLAEGLRANSSLTDLGLDDNQVTDAGGLELADALKLNRSLVHLNLRSNKLTDAAGHAFAEMLAVNDSLTALTLGDNLASRGGG